MSVEKLNPNSKLPLYHQLYEIFQDKIRAGDWKPGDMISPESELIAAYGVSRITVRKVLDMLVKEGHIRRERGRGTFVAHPRLEHGMTRIVSFTEDMRQRGFSPGTRIIFSGLVPAPTIIADALGVPAGEELARIDRLRLADEEPLCVEESFLVHRLMPGILEHDLKQKSLREVKLAVYGIRWSRATQTIRAIAAPPETAHLLSIKVGAPLLFFERVTRSQEDVPVEFLRIFYRADRYILHNDLAGGDG
jgi:GntR family transcriptional regulator